MFYYTETVFDKSAFSFYNIMLAVLKWDDFVRQLSLHATYGAAIEH